MANAAGILDKNERRNDAMLSVYQACSECKGAVIPGQAAAIPLNEAVDILLKDDRWDAFFIRQRALVRLLRAKVHRRHALGDVVDGLAEAVGCPPDGVRKAVDDPALDGPTKEMNCFRALEVPMRERLGVGRSFDLEKRTPTTKVLYSPTSLSSKVTGTVEVPGRPEDFAAAGSPLDGQPVVAGALVSAVAAATDQQPLAPRPLVATVAALPMQSANG